MVNRICHYFPPSTVSPNLAQTHVAEACHLSDRRWFLEIRSVVHGEPTILLYVHKSKSEYIAHFVSNCMCKHMLCFWSIFRVDHTYYWRICSLVSMVPSLMVLIWRRWFWLLVNILSPSQIFHHSWLYDKDRIDRNWNDLLYFKSHYPSRKKCTCTYDQWRVLSDTLTVCNHALAP